MEYMWLLQVVLCLGKIVAVPGLLSAVPSGTELGVKACSRYQPGAVTRVL